MFRKFFSSFFLLVLVLLVSNPVLSQSRDNRKVRKLKKNLEKVGWPEHLINAFPSDSLESYEIKAQELVRSQSSQILNRIWYDQKTKELLIQYIHTKTEKTSRISNDLLTKTSVTTNGPDTSEVTFFQYRSPMGYPFATAPNNSSDPGGYMKESNLISYERNIIDSNSRKKDQTFTYSRNETFVRTPNTDSYLGKQIKSYKVIRKSDSNETSTLYYGTYYEYLLRPEESGDSIIPICIVEGAYSENGDRIGIWKYYDYNQEKLKTCEHYTSDGILTLSQNYDPQGNLIQEHIRKPDSDLELIKHYWEGGTLKQVFDLKEGNHYSFQKEYYKDGTLKHTKLYDSTGVLYQTKKWFSDGTLRSEINYVNNQRDGLFISGNRNYINIIRSYSQGKLMGKVYTYDYQESYEGAEIYYTITLLYQEYNQDKLEQSARKTLFLSSKEMDDLLVEKYDSRLIPPEEFGLP